MSRHLQPLITGLEGVFKEAGEPVRWGNGCYTAPPWQMVERVLYWPATPSEPTEYKAALDLHLVRRFCRGS